MLRAQLRPLIPFLPLRAFCGPLSPPQLLSHQSLPAQPPMQLPCWSSRPRQLQPLWAAALDHLGDRPHRTPANHYPSRTSVSLSVKGDNGAHFPGP